MDKIIEVRGAASLKGTTSNEAIQNTLNTKSLDEILGYSTEMSKGVYKYTIRRPDVQLKAPGVTVITFMGFNTWASFQG